MDRVLAMMFSAFGHDCPCIEVCLPCHDFLLGRKRGDERMVAVKRNDLKTTFINVVPPRRGKIIAVATWNIVPQDGV